MLRLTLISLLLFPGAAWAQTQTLALLPEPFAYPAQGQSPQQQQTDQAACSAWAQQQTGVNPAQLSTATTAQSSQAGRIVQETARGGLLGLVGGAIWGNAGRGAASGAAVGALSGVLDMGHYQRQQQQAETQAQRAEKEQLRTYYRAWGTCMEGRGYTVSQS